MPADPKAVSAGQPEKHSNQRRHLETGFLAILFVFFSVLMLFRPNIPVGAPQAHVTSDQTTAVPATTPPAAAPSPHGIDVSHYQGVINWPKVKSAGVSYAFLKATEGVTYVDPKFHRNREGAAKAGLIIGAYHFFEPKDDPVKQAEFFLKTTAFKAGWLPPVLDLEVSAPAKNGQIGAAAVKWLMHVEKQTGCTPLVYASPSFYKASLGAEVSAYPLYLAEYSAKPTPPKDAGPLMFWQHTQTGRVKGVTGHVDRDRFVLDGQTLEDVLCKK